MTTSAMAAPRSSLPVLSVEGISKTFGAARVLTDFCLTVPAGEVCALVGQNGSGKSTFIKILSGFQPPDAGGRVLVAGQDKEWWDRIAFVHQDLGFIDDATILENLAGSSRRRPLAILDWRKERRRTEEILALAGLDLAPNLSMGALQPADKALIALGRARHELSARDDAVLVLDEPTAYLPSDRIQDLLTQIRESAAAGIAVLMVTHHLKEVMAVADRVTVLRDGITVYTEKVADTSEDRIVEAMIGTKIDASYPPRVKPHAAEPLLMLDQVATEEVRPVSLTIGPGEILGLTGLVGSGWESLPYAIMGAPHGVTGKMRLRGEGERQLSTMTPRRARQLGLALVPADRVRDSVVGDLSVEENVTLPSLGKYCSGPVVSLSARRRRADELLTEYDVRPALGDVMMSTLSGGNQQKVVMAKWLEIEPRVLILHEPTQGVDVGARRQIHEYVMAAAERGAAVIIASAEQEDLANLCHRVHVFRHGRIARTLSGDELTVASLLGEVQDVPAAVREDSHTTSAREEV